MTGAALIDSNCPQFSGSAHASRVYVAPPPQAPFGDRPCAYPFGLRLCRSVPAGSIDSRIAHALTLSGCVYVARFPPAPFAPATWRRSRLYRPSPSPQSLGSILLSSSFSLSSHLLIMVITSRTTVEGRGVRHVPARHRQTRCPPNRAPHPPGTNCFVDIRDSRISSLPAFAGRLPGPSRDRPKAN